MFSVRYSHFVLSVVGKSGCVGQHFHDICVTCFRAYYSEERAAHCFGAAVTVLGVALFAFSLFAGVVPRVSWIGIGGFVYFGVYDSVRGLCSSSSSSGDNL